MLFQPIVGFQFQILVNQCSNLEGKRQSLQNQLEVERINAGEQITFLEQKLRGVQVTKLMECIIQLKPAIPDPRVTKVRQ